MRTNSMMVMQRAFLLFCLLYFKGLCTDTNTGGKTKCMLDVTENIKQLCHRQILCDFHVHLDTFIKDAYYLFPCGIDIDKYIEIYWNCDETGTNYLPLKLFCGGFID